MGGGRGGQISAFPIDCDSGPYDTLAVPCKCVTASTDFCLHRFLLAIRFLMLFFFRIFRFWAMR